MNVRELTHLAGLDLPSPPMPVGNYQAAIIGQNTLYISGQMPIQQGSMHYQGKLGKDLTIEQGQAAASLAAMNVLSQIDAALKGSEYQFGKIIRLDGYINATADFAEHAAVLNGASDLFATVLGEQSGHIRTVLGCNSLPADAAVELAATVELIK